MNLRVLLRNSHTASVLRHWRGWGHIVLSNIVYMAAALTMIAAVVASVLSLIIIVEGLLR